jgi:hypothetical protein
MEAMQPPLFHADSAAHNFTYYRLNARIARVISSQAVFVSAGPV